MKKMKNMTAIIIAKNEASMITACIKTVQWCEQVIVVDTGSCDETTELAEQHGAQVIQFQHTSFARLRNEALKYLKTDWCFYIDADERVTPTLAKEIMVAIETTNSKAFSLRRKNIFFGEELKHGGWQEDVVTRIFHKSVQLKWTGAIHESAQFSGENKLLESSLIHFSHRDVASGLIKSAAWTPIEANLLYKDGIGKVTLLTVLRKGLGEFFRRNIIKQGYKDGSAGTFEAVVQAINRMLVYIQVWEQQQDPSIKQKYSQLENKLIESWKSEP